MKLLAVAVAVVLFGSVGAVLFSRTAGGSAYSGSCALNASVWNAGTGDYNGTAGDGVAVWTWLGCNGYHWLSVGGQLWDETLNQEVFDTGHDPYAWDTAAILEDPNTMTWEDYPCQPGHRYAVWVYGWVSGTYVQRDVGSWQPC